MFARFRSYFAEQRRQRQFAVTWCMRRGVRIRWWWSFQRIQQFAIESLHVELMQVVIMKDNILESHKHALDRIDFLEWQLLELKGKRSH